MELRHSGIKVSLIELRVPSVLASPTTSIRRKVMCVENPRIAARFTLGPEAVVDKVRHAFISEKPKMRYPVTLVTGGNGAYACCRGA